MFSNQKLLSTAQKKLGKALSVSILNQIVCSGTNFVFGLYLVRVLTPKEYGLYAISFSISLFYTGLGNSLFLTQMVVHTPYKLATERLMYATRVFTIMLVFSLITLALTLAIYLLYFEYIGQYRIYYLSVTVVSIGYFLKEFFIRHAYNMRKERWALIINSSLAISLLSLVLINSMFQAKVSVELVIFEYTVAYFFSIFIALILSKLQFSRLNIRTLIGVFLECWVGGRWAGLTNIICFLRTQAHIIIVATYLGPVGVAYMSATRLLVQPCVVAIPALGQVFMPRLAEEGRHNPPKMYTTAKLITGLLLAFAILYSVILLLNLTTIAQVVLKGKYTESIFWFAFYWCLISCLLPVRHIVEMLAQILKYFKNLMMINGVSASVALLTAWVLVNFVGSIGALIGYSIGEFVQITLVVFFLYHYKKEHSPINRILP